jgi:hypothetical protein
VAVKWSTTPESESFEVDGLIEAYARLPQPIRFSIVFDGPPPGFSGSDFFVVESVQQKGYGVELTSVYLSERSVPDVHMREIDRAVDIPDSREAMAAYEGQIVDAVAAKV